MSAIEFTGERLPGGGDAEFAIDMQRHLAAYRYAATLAAGRSVLDAGCGEGYGTALLAGVAASVTGIDRPEVAAAAQARYASTGAAFEGVDLDRLADLGRRFDLVVSFQVIEHVVDPLGYLRALAACTADGGTLLVTTPNRLMTMSENPYHLREWIAAELLALAAPVLPGVQVLGMHGSPRVVAYERARGAQVQRILRLDPLGIRKLLPGVVIERIFPVLARLVRRRVAGGAGLPTVGPDDFHVGPENMNEALDLVLVARIGS
jgi:SAM-dependent methyltransferase